MSKPILYAAYAEYKKAQESERAMFLRHEDVGLSEGDYREWRLLQERIFNHAHHLRSPEQVRESNLRKKVTNTLTVIMVLLGVYLFLQ